MSLFVTKNLLLQVVRKDHSGRTVRVSNYLKTDKTQKPVSEQIYYPDGNSTLYLYNEAGERIDRMAKVERVEEKPKID